MTQKRKRTHWVSQSYLRLFAADADERQKTWRFSKDNGEPELKPIAKVAVRHYLYVPDTTSPTGIIHLNDYRWKPCCRGLYQLPAAA
jgi:hypothetical protein